jgi:hypothetical protein
MKRALAVELLQDFEALYAASGRANWHPAESPPQAVQRWMAASPLLLYFFRRLLAEGLEEDAHVPRP